MHGGLEYEVLRYGSMDQPIELNAQINTPRRRQHGKPYEQAANIETPKVVGIMLVGWEDKIHGFTINAS
ncbi:aldehyde dehydrogenase family 2 member B4, mitochondrial [Corchorus olitorius]|uniref:Aldehyde dehydrogenase family 2 member B4, mitochondrial n=1 Tax=Corchorus olitorius TaxID=93759 RepID=A0A1R3GTB9_9ROSI|nr:aldehyde dehydrogenase family 2 member B4, mitochondrial [Corchorus olitorius]